MTGTRRQSLLQSLSWFAASYVVSLVGYLSVNALAARFLGADDFGVFVVIYSSALFVGLISLLGVHRSGLREGSRVDSADDPMLLELRADVWVIHRTTQPATALLSGLGAALLSSGTTTERVTLGFLVAS